MIHSFLRSIGFREMKKSSDVYELLEEIINHPDIQQAEVDQNGNTFIECKKEFGDGIGIAVCGDYLDNTEFHMQYYYPYLLGTSDSTWEPVEIERHAEKESYAGICDDVRLGVTLIFYVQNHTEVMRERKLAGHYRNGVSATLSGLASYGKILLPIQKTRGKSGCNGTSDIAGYGCLYIIVATSYAGRYFQYCRKQFHAIWNRK